MKRLMISTAAAAFAATAATAATDMMDVDMTNDGFVGYEELKLAYPDVSEEAFDQIDLNGDNRISSEELLETEAQDLLATYTMVPSTERQQVVLDANYDRFISKEEFVAVFPSFSEIDFQSMDANNDERVDYTEFYDTDAQDTVARYYGGTVIDIAQIDADGDSFADFNEMMGTFPQISEVELNEIDTNNDKRISSEELYEPRAQQIISRN